MTRKYRLFRDIYTYLENIGNKAIKEEKKIIIYGHSKCGVLIKEILGRICPSAEVAYFIENNNLIPEIYKLKAYRYTLLDYIDNSKFIIISTVKDFQNVELEINNHTKLYEKNNNLFDFRNDIGNDYIDYLEKAKGCDFSEIYTYMKPDIYNGDNHHFSNTCFSNIDSVFENIMQLVKEPKVFDMGCGKGFLLIFSYISNALKIAGLEYNESIYKICKENLKKLNIDCDIFLGNGGEFTDFDDYNIFLFNNSFGGDTFDSFIKNLENSFKKNPRDIYFVYINTALHKRLLDSSNFKLYKLVEIDFADPILNIYKLSDENN